MTQAEFENQLTDILKIQDAIAPTIKLNVLKREMGSDEFDEKLIAFMKQARGNFLLSNLNELTFDSPIPKIFFSLYAMRHLFSPVARSMTEDQMDSFYSLRRIGFLGGEKS